MLLFFSIKYDNFILFGEKQQKINLILHCFKLSLYANCRQSLRFVQISRIVRLPKKEPLHSVDQPLSTVSSEAIETRNFNPIPLFSDYSSISLHIVSYPIRTPCAAARNPDNTPDNRLDFSKNTRKAYRSRAGGTQ